MYLWHFDFTEFCSKSRDLGSGLGLSQPLQDCQIVIDMLLTWLYRWRWVLEISYLRFMLTVWSFVEQQPKRSLSKNLSMFGQDLHGLVLSSIQLRKNHAKSPNIDFPEH